jgi:CRP-like cAMP-binding protein
MRAPAQVIVPKKSKVVSQGDPGDAFYIVETGVLAVLKDGKPIMRLSPGQVRDLTRART